MFSKGQEKVWNQLLRSAWHSSIPAYQDVKKNRENITKIIQGLVFFRMYKGDVESWPFTGFPFNFFRKLFVSVFLSFHCFTSCMLNIPFIFYLTSFTYFCWFKVHHQMTSNLSVPVWQNTMFSQKDCSLQFNELNF